MKIKNRKFETFDAYRASRIAEALEAVGTSEELRSQYPSFYSVLMPALRKLKVFGIGNGYQLVARGDDEETAAMQAEYERRTESGIYTEDGAGTPIYFRRATAEAVLRRANKALQAIRAARSNAATAPEVNPKRRKRRGRVR